MSKVIIQGLRSRRIITQGYAPAAVPESPLPRTVLKVAHQRRVVAAAHTPTVIAATHPRRTVDVG